MQLKVQNSTRTTFPRSSAAVSGGELSQLVAAVKEGIPPSLGKRESVAIVGCVTLLSSAEFAIGAATAVARIAVSHSCLAFVMRRLRRRFLISVVTSGASGTPRAFHR